MKDDKHCDVFGTPLKVGDYVIYAANLDRSAILKVAVILELRSIPKGWGTPPIAYKVSTRTAERSMTRDPKTREWDNYEWKLQKKGSPITLEFTERMVKVNPKVIPKALRDLLKEEP